MVSVPDDGDAASLLRCSTYGSLATIQAAGDAPDGVVGHPHASLVQTAPDRADHPILLISRLAQHTQALLRDPRCSLLLDGTTPGSGRLEGPRLTIIGAAEITQDADIRDRFLAKHPDAALYVDFTDFAFWRIIPKAAHLVAGFGRIRWLDAW